MRTTSGHSIIRAFLFVALLFTLASCVQKFEQIRITSCKILSFSPKGFHNAEAVVALGIDNPATSFTVSNFEMIIKSGGTTIGVLKADSVAVGKASSKEYTVPCTATLESLSLSEILDLAGNADFSVFTADISANVRTGKGAGRNIEFKDIKISDLFR